MPDETQNDSDRPVIRLEDARPVVAAPEESGPVRVPPDVPSITPPPQPRTVPEVLAQLHANIVSALHNAHKLLDVPVTGADLHPRVFDSLGELSRRLMVLDGSVRDARIALGILAGIHDIKSKDPKEAITSIREMRAETEKAAAPSTGK